MLRPDINYTGLDIQVYNQVKGYEKYADNLVFTDPENFHNSIENLENKFDGVISAHNIEHCLYPDKVLHSMIKKVNENGFFYLSFPSDATTKFPSRKGTLNFYDDNTHRTLINFNKTIELLKSNGFQILYSTKRYRPIIPAIIGLLVEPISMIKKQVMPFRATWSLYGFESIIFAKKMTNN